MDFDRPRDMQQFNPPNFNTRLCFYCGKPGHKAADCFHQFKDMRMASKGMSMNGIPPLRTTIRQTHSSMPRYAPSQRYVQTEQRFIPRPTEPRIQERQERHERQDRPQADQRSERSQDPPYDEFTDALAYMSERRAAMGREDFKNLVCNTELGVKLHECLLDFENQLN